MDDTCDSWEIIEDGESVVEGFAYVERDGEAETAGEFKHLLKEANLGGAVEGLVVVVEADFADGDEFGGS